MKVIGGSTELPASERGVVLTVGNFDGIHLGHLALIRELMERGAALGVKTAVYTFDPHPRQVLYPDRVQARLMSWEQMALELQELGVDFLIREPFTREFASLSAEAFLQGVIAERIAPRDLLVGRDFQFGKDRSGSDETLARIGPDLGIRIAIIPQVTAGGSDVSSTRIRKALGEGDVSDAALCLGRPYSVWGKIVEGDRRGRTLGFPTANLEPENELIPANGVYATTVRIFEEGRLSAEERPAVTNIGTRPTFDKGQVLAETHLLDFSGDLYGRRISLAFCERIRDEKRFSGPAELKAQIAEDARRAGEILRSRNS
ncbi:MAG: bifunctional riboflavin kinase/FAD synthetase [bacterium]|nr:bifunctional riboflavin kinase/FAD synthetase [bacterium]